MDRLIDEVVQVSVKDALAAAAATAVNTVAVLGVSTKSGVKTGVQYSQADVEKAYDTEAGDETEAYVSDISKVTKAFFRSNNPGRIVCIPTASVPTEDSVKGILESAISMGRDDNGRVVDFYHIMVRLDSGSADEILALVRAIDEWCVENFRLAHVEIMNKATVNEVRVSLAIRPAKRVAVYFHAEESENSLAAAIVAERCATDPARGTWAHKTLENIIADPILKSEFRDFEDCGINFYTTIASVGDLCFGTIGGSNDVFIDEVIKKDWLKFRTQEAIFDALRSANNGDGVDYNDDGIAAIFGAVNKVFTLASDNSHRYVLPGSYEITVPKYAEISEKEKKVRNLPDVKATFEIQASIQTVKTVELQVVA